MTAQTWGHLAGDTRAFAVDHRFHPDPDPGERDPAEALTWGSFAIYADGRNLCEQHYDGETVERVHWYLLPLMEWLVASWERIFHEQRLPDAKAIASAADVDAWAAWVDLPTDDAGWERLERWQTWDATHSLRAAADGGAFPDLYFRRVLQGLEVSVGSERPLPGVPSPATFRHQGLATSVPLSMAASAWFDVLSLAVAHPRERDPEEPHFQQLERDLESLR